MRGYLPWVLLLLAAGCGKGDPPSECTGGFAQAAVNFALPAGWDSADGGDCIAAPDLVDLDGDGFVDWIFTYCSNDPTVGDDEWIVYSGSAEGFAADPVEWPLPSAEDCGGNLPPYALSDLTGDGRMDFVMLSSCGGDGSHTWYVHPGVDGGFATDGEAWPLPEYEHVQDWDEWSHSVLGSVHWRVLDVTDDDLPDLVITEDPDVDPTVGADHWNLHANNGSGFSAEARTFALPSGYATEDNPRPFSQGIGSNVLVDVDADGKRDLVLIADERDPLVGDSYWTVHRGTGDGYAADGTQFALPLAYGLGGRLPFGGTSGSECNPDAELSPVFSFGDVDGDAEPDLLVASTCDAAGEADGVGTDHWLLYPGGPDGVAADPVEWALPTGYESVEGGTFAGFDVDAECDDGEVGHRFLVDDMDGDGRPDLVVQETCDGTVGGEVGHWAVHFGACR